MTESEERALLDALSLDYAWGIASELSRRGRVVGGTPRAHATATWIRDRFIRDVGIPPGDVGLEEFPVISFDVDEDSAGDSVGLTRLEIEEDGVWVPIPAVQALKGRGTGRQGVTAEVVDVAEGRLSDFEGRDVRGKIVLFSATDVLFYGAPVQINAAQRGAAAAIIHWPIAPDAALRLHTMAGFLPMVSITNDDAKRIRQRTARGSVRARLVVENRFAGTPRHTGQNVVAVIRGEEFPEEFVYLCAHYDHWFSSAADNNAGVGSLLAIAKGIVTSGIRPRRTLVFVAFDAEELGGWADSWFDWLIGSYSHIVETLTGPAVHPDRRGKIAAMINMDVVGTRGAEVILESTPEFTPFVRQVATDSGLRSAVPTKLFSPPTSYDDWPFFQVGAPVCQIAWWGSAYEPRYHTTADTLETLDPANVRLNLRFNGLAVLRSAQAAVHPIDLRETMKSIELGLSPLREADSARLLDEDLAVLGETLQRFERAVQEIASRPIVRELDVKRLNERLRGAVAILNPVLFAWDFATSLPGWAGVFRLKNPIEDLISIRTAIGALRAGRGEAAGGALEGVATMQWGRFMDPAGYRRMLDYLVSENGRHMLWGRGFVPPLSDVHPEFAGIARKLADGIRDFSAEVASLDRKTLDLVHRLRPVIGGIGKALREAADLMSLAR